MKVLSDVHEDNVCKKLKGLQHCMVPAYVVFGLQFSHMAQYLHKMQIFLLCYTYTKPYQAVCITILHRNV